MKEKGRSLTLEIISSGLFTTDTGKKVSDKCAVRVIDDKKETPAKDVTIIFKVADGEALFSATESKEIELKTDRGGKASPDVVLTQKGSAIISAMIVGDENALVAFQGYTEGVSHRLYLYSDPTFPADPGEITFRATAIDHHDEPVTDADLFVDAYLDGHHPISGEIETLENGEYAGSLQTNVAGPWIINLFDRTTKVIARKTVTVLPEAPAAIKLVGETDPRAKEPYDKVLLRSRRVDKFNNSLDPHSINCSVNGAALEPHSIVNNEARFLLDAGGYSELKVSLTDRETDIAEEVTILAASAWLQKKPFIEVGSVFKTELFFVPPVGKPVDKAKIEVKYDPKLASFKSFTLAEVEGMPIATEVTTEGSSVFISVTSERKIDPVEYSGGILIGYAEWNCLDEGKTWFQLCATMSPPTIMWAMCIRQKKREIKSICLNFIYNEADPRSRRAVFKATPGNSLSNIFNAEDALDLCCPFVTFRIGFTPLSGLDWFTDVVVPTGTAGFTPVGGLGPIPTTPAGTITSKIQFPNFGRSFAPATPPGTEVGVRDCCINIYLVDISMPDGTLGLTSPGPQKDDPADPNEKPKGFSTIDPDALADPAEGTHTLGHEIGHALGLDDDKDNNKDMLMYGFTGSTDTQISEDGMR